jgi:hypothetical protein
MKTIIYAIFFVGLVNVSTRAHAVAANGKSLCGANTPSAQIRLALELYQQDEFSTIVVTSVNGVKPGRVDPSSKDSRASGFGPHGYESVTLSFTSGCAGTAKYSHFNASRPMMPMEDIQLKCICQ